MLPSSTKQKEEQENQLAHHEYVSLLQEKNIFIV
jgi:hypothetical protein